MWRRAGARLTVLEPASTGLPKIGKAGQWLAIKATNNKPGFVDAHTWKNCLEAFRPQCPVGLGRAEPVDRGSLAC